MSLLDLYKKSISQTTMVSKESVEALNLLQDKTLEAIDTNITKRNLLVSNISSKVIQGDFNNLLEANRAVHKSLQSYNKTLELIQFKILPIARERYTDMRTLRDHMEGSFLTNPEVVSSITSIAGRKANFEALFSELMQGYQKVKNYNETIYQLTNFLNEGVRTLGSLSKFLYSYDQMQQTEMYTSESVESEGVAQEEISEGIRKRTRRTHNKQPSTESEKKPLTRKRKRAGVKWLKD